MKTIQPKFEDKVVFLAVDIGYNANFEDVLAFAEERNYPWPVGQANIKMLTEFDVNVQSTKIAIDADGLIVYRAGYGQGTSEEWMRVFDTMLD